MVNQGQAARESSPRAPRPTATLHANASPREPSKLGRSPEQTRQEVWLSPLPRPGPSLPARPPCFVSTCSLTSADRNATLPPTLKSTQTQNPHAE